MESISIDDGSDGNKTSEDFGQEETKRRVEAALRGAFRTPPKTYEESKVGKRKGKPGQSPGPRKRKSQAKKPGK